MLPRVVLPNNTPSQRYHLRVLDGVNALSPDHADLLPPSDESNVVAVEETHYADEAEGYAEGFYGHAYV